MYGRTRRSCTVLYCELYTVFDPTVKFIYYLFVYLFIYLFIVYAIRTAEKIYTHKAATTKKKYI